MTRATTQRVRIALLVLTVIWAFLGFRSGILHEPFEAGLDYPVYLVVQGGEFLRLQQEADEKEWLYFWMSIAPVFFVWGLVWVATGNVWDGAAPKDSDK